MKKDKGDGIARNICWSHEVQQLISTTVSIGQQKTVMQQLNQSGVRV